ncbi:hypothetical protein LY78DRAFT_670971 [Colletotrichum sublineola]|nr:hypothetical protein LY78DRAFT_670971 [Colletotrichum sublineola]
MHIPTFGQVATIGMAFLATAALAVPIAEPLETDIVERSPDLAIRGEGISAIESSVHALEQRNRKKKCKRTKKGICVDSDSDDDKKNKKKCKRNKKGNCTDSDSDDDKKNKKKCKRNKKGNCTDSDSDDDKKKCKRNRKGKCDDGKNKGDKGDNGGDKGNNGGHVQYRREIANDFNLE